VCEGGGCCDVSTCVASGAELSGGDLCVAGGSATCGADGEICCQDSTCDNADSCCVAGVCVANGATCGVYGTCNAGECTGGMDGTCGGNGDACCDGNPNGNGEAYDFCTSAGYACNPDNDECYPCGGPGQPCCEGNFCEAGGCCDHNEQDWPVCIANGESCSGGQGTCSNGGCRGGDCGVLGHSCCGNDVRCTAPFTDCAGGTCMPCGGLAQRCCDSASGSYCGAPYVCANNGNTCVACGDIGEPCCLADTCAVGTCNGATNTCQN
jgi:hypothetical protein